MPSGQYFYHSSIRNMCSVFGTVFNNISIKRKDSDSNVVQTLKVPISYAPKQKFLALLEEKQTSVAITLPRMSFQFLSINYNNEHKLNTFSRMNKMSDDSNKTDYSFNSVPFIMDFELNIYAKNTDDGVQILEQILPFFTPSFKVSVNEVPELGIKRDIPILFRSLTTQDEFEGDMLTRRVLIFTLTFEMRTNFYGPVKESGLIKDITINLYDEIGSSEKVSQYDVRPNPFTAGVDDVFTLDETWDEDFTVHLIDEENNHLVDENGIHIIGGLN